MRANEEANMQDVEAVADNTATDESIVEEDQTETQENGDDSEESDTAQESADTDDEEKSRSQLRREKRRQAQERQRAELERTRAALDEAQARISELEGFTSKQTPPKESDFASYEEYQAALSGYHASRQFDARERARLDAARKRASEEHQRAQEAQQREVAENWQTAQSEARTRYTDFDAVIATAPVSPQLSNMVVAMESGADVAYQLGKDHALAHRLSQLPPIEAAMELGRIEARISRPSPRKISTAPEPVRPVRPKASISKDPSDMSPAEFRAAREAGKI